MMRTELGEAMALLQPREVARLCEGRVVRGRQSAAGVSTDTRDLRRGDCFVALDGDRFDGHDYIREAFARGAAGVVVSRSVPRDLVPAGGFVVKVNDTFDALGQLAAEYRRRMSARVVGVTGSCGKTTTKEMLGRVLERVMPCVRSPKSFNNRVGVPLTLFLMDKETRAAVVEIGSSEPGEIAQLTAIAAPDIAIVTCVAEAHLTGFGSVGGVAREKASLVAGLAADGVAILNGDDNACRAMADRTDARSILVRIDHEADWFATDARFCGMGTTFRLQGERLVTLPMLGTHAVYNALLTIAAAVELGMELDEVLEGLATLPPTRRRLEPVVAGGITVFDDTYNMNPASAHAGLRALCGMQGKGRKLVVFGGMAELGVRSDALHHELGERVARSDVDLFMAVGRAASPIAEGALAAGMKSENILLADNIAAGEDMLFDLLQPDDMVLCKASRQFELDRLVDALVARLAERAASPVKKAAKKPARRPSTRPSTSPARRPKKTAARLKVADTP